MELLRKTIQADRKKQLEASLTPNPTELPADRRLTGSSKHRHRAAAATRLQPNIETTTALLNQIGRRTGNDETHQLKSTDSSALLAAAAGFFPAGRRFDQAMLAPATA